MKVAAAAAALAIVSLVAADAQAPRVTARIRGRVVAAATGRPLLRATVQLMSADNQKIFRAIKTDSNGRYELGNLPRGRYSFFAAQTGYLDQQFDQPHPLARYRLLELADGEQLDAINFNLHRGAAITGVITDDRGDPLTDVRVEALRQQFGSNGRSLRQERNRIGEIRTDDEGRYRIYGLRPGSYAVRAFDQVIDGDLDLGRTYYPGTASETDAQMVRVDLGLDAVADFAMIPAQRARVAGIVLDSRGRPASDWLLTLHEVRGSSIEAIGGERTGNDGSFEIARVLPGRYILHVRPSFTRDNPSSASAESALVPLALAGDDITDLIVTSSPGSTISGRVTFEGLATNPLVNGLRIFALPADPALQQAGIVRNAESDAIDTNGRFSIAGIRGHVRIAGGADGWFPKRVLLRGVDITATGFDVAGNIDGIEVLLTNKRTTVTGTARDARGIASNDYIVAFFPTGDFRGPERARRQRTIRPDPDGVYRILGLPAGEYFAAAVPALSLPAESEWDPAFLEKVRPWATGFRLFEGQTLSLNFTLIE